MWLPLGFHEWMPAAQALTLGLLTFVQEDVPTVCAALLTAAGSLNWNVGFLGCFLGIWIGDALLYGLARWAGRPLMQRSWRGSSRSMVGSRLPCRTWPGPHLILRPPPRGLISRPRSLSPGGFLASRFCARSHVSVLPRGPRPGYGARDSWAPLRLGRDRCRCTHRRRRGLTR